MRLFRNYDRQLHQANYPALSYPELYLVYGGYSQFYEPNSVGICCIGEWFVRTTVRFCSLSVGKTSFRTLLLTRTFFRFSLFL